jgi:hypothetical protein
MAQPCDSSRLSDGSIAKELSRVRPDHDSPIHIVGSVTDGGSARRDGGVGKTYRRPRFAAINRGSATALQPRNKTSQTRRTRFTTRPKAFS